MSRGGHEISQEEIIELRHIITEMHNVHIPDILTTNGQLFGGSWWLTGDLVFITAINHKYQFWPDRSSADISIFCHKDFFRKFDAQWTHFLSCIWKPDIFENII